MIDQFDALVKSQKQATEPWRPVTDYSFEARKAIEEPHARLILEAFQPTSILDVGCGFKTLVNLLNGTALLNGFASHPIARGADISNPEADVHLDIAMGNLWSSDRADLVICREVLEHLTVRQIRQAVTNLCRLALRFVYCTTRFNPNPSHLFDVATSDDLDPTHISMLPQDLLRALFVLEGFTRRSDLEAKLDWKKLGRVLVYERV